MSSLSESVLLRTQDTGAAPKKVGLKDRFYGPERQKWWKKKKNEMYRTSRKLHTYVSAAAFLLLMFFAFSGLLLNHPEWFQGQRVQIEQTLELPEETLEAALATEFPGTALAVAVQQATDIPGTLTSFEDLGDGYQLAFRGLAGSGSVFVDTDTGETEIRIRKATLTDKIHVLHKGKNTGALWSWIIDLTAYLTLGLSLFGFIILFTVKMRLQNSMRTIGVSLGIIAAAIVFAVP
ncbi:MAG: PepSY-associated TM helix domain-containing protein [Kordiimonas sp.]